MVGHTFDARVDYRRFRFTLGQGLPAAGRGSGAARVLSLLVRYCPPRLMSKRLLLLWISALFLLLGTALAACGDDDDDDGGGGAAEARRRARSKPSSPAR